MVKKSNRGNFFDNYRITGSYILDSKNYILFIILLFLISSLIGVIYPEIFKESIKNFLSELFNKVKDYDFFRLVFFIIKNNVLSALSSLVFGIFFGIFPLVTSIANGYVLGFVAGMSAQIAGPSVILRLLPHGIFELPAIFISLGLGLRLGLSIFIKGDKNKFRDNFISSVKVFLFWVVPLLIIAGIIEAALIVLSR